ncbi:MAG: sulfurtransferase TusA family protein [Candidatus Helarchaeota archaeon]
MTEEDIKISLTIDTKGQTCPFPLIEVKKAITKLDTGQVLKLITTDPICPDNVDTWCENTGNTLIRVDNHENEIIIYVKKG